MSHDPNSKGVIGIISGPYEGATRVYIRSFYQSSCICGLSITLKQSSIPDATPEASFDARSATCGLRDGGENWVLDYLESQGSLGYC